MRNFFLLNKFKINLRQIMCKLDRFVGCTQSKATFVIQPVYNNYKWDRDTTDYIQFATTTQQNEINL